MRFEVEVMEVRHVPVLYTVTARSPEEAREKAERGDTDEEHDAGLGEVADRRVETVELME